MFVKTIARVLLAAAMMAMVAPSVRAAESGGVTEGRLDAIGPQGKPLGPCPLKHTDVTVDIAGFIARVTVRQQFHNPFSDKIEAVYVFPLSQDAAVDSMTMTVGKRVIKGEIKERGEARAIYESAKAQGQVASLLDQERPNIFTQSVANIEPGEQVDITISYSETLDWIDGNYHFDFPMVVGPRYIPGGGTAPAPLTTGRPTDQVPRADRITPPVTPQGTRAGHDITVTVHLDAGVPVQRLDSLQHEVSVQYAADDKSRAVVKLKEQRTIPNKDFVLEYQTATERIEDAVLAHTDERGKFFTIVLQPPKRVRVEQIVPKELIFVIDKSGSMRGFPIETAKQAMAMCIDGLHPNDTFNLMTFAGGVGFCFEKPVPNTEQNRQKAHAYLASLQGSGGTEMMKAIHACLAGQNDPERVRVVCFMTDGYVGNDLAIIDAVAANAGLARVFSFGIGTSVNRFLLDSMARAGRGEVHYILNQREASGAAERFYERVRSPVLTDIELDYAGVNVEEVYPSRIPDLFSSTPVVVKGRYKQGGHGTITLRGQTGNGPFQRRIDIHLPDQQPKDDVLAPLWARAKVHHLMQKDLAGMQRGNPNPAVKEEILGLGMRYQLLTQFTSFVAVEQIRITEGGQARTIAVPVEMPAGVSYEGVFGNLAPGAGRSAGAFYSYGAPAPASPAARGATRLRRLALDRTASLREAKPEDADEAEEARSAASNSKLAAKLQHLAEKLAKAGNPTSTVIDGIRIRHGRVEVRVQLDDLSDKTVAQLKALGFQELARAKSVYLLVGTIKVEKLTALAELKSVRRVVASNE